MTQTLNRPASYEVPATHPAADYEAPTGVLPAVDETGALPSLGDMHDGLPVPSAASVYNSHDLISEAKTSLAHDTADPEGSVVMTPIAVADAQVAVRALFLASKQLASGYGEEAYEHTRDKARAVVDVSIAKSMPSTVEAYEPFDRLREGMAPVPGFKTLDPEADEMHAFVEAPLSPVGPETLALDEKDYHMVLDGLRIMALIRKGNLEAVEAMDLISRLTPSHSEKAFYDAELERAGIRRDIAQLPQYNTGADSLLQ
jgi:hypothetical protein